MNKAKIISMTVMALMLNGTIAFADNESKVNSTKDARPNITLVKSTAKAVTSNYFTPEDTASIKEEGGNDSDSKTGNSSTESSDTSKSKAGDSGTANNKKDFRNMPLADKKKAIIDKFTQKTDDAVKQGKISEADANKFLTDLKAAVAKWNGTGDIGIRPPDALCKHCMDKLNIKSLENLTPEQRKEKVLSKFTSRIDKRVKAGKLTQAEADKLLSDLKASVDNWDGKDIHTLQIPKELFHGRSNSTEQQSKGSSNT